VGLEGVVGGGVTDHFFGWGGVELFVCFLVCLLGDEEEWMSWIWELDRLKGFLMLGLE